MDNVLHFTDSAFKEAVLNSDKPVLVDFWADWCGPCHMLTPTIKELANELDGKVRIGKLDVDANQATAVQFGIFSIPTLILFKNGREVARLVGVRPKHDILKTIENHIKDSVAA